MTVSWFRSSDNNSGKVPMKEAVKALYPSRSTSHWERRPEDRSRFSNLLLAHGEKHIQDWAVIAYTNPCPPGTSLLNSNTTMNGNHSSSHLNAPANRKHPKQTQWAQATTTTTTTNTTTTSMDAATQKQQQQRKLKQQHKKQNATTKPDKDSYPSMHMTKIEGRLHLCSLSIVFEPTDPTRPCLRCPFMRMDAAPKEYPPDVVTSNTTGNNNNKSSNTITTGSYEPMCVELACTRHYTMKANHAIGPFETVPLSTLIRFTFLHSSPRPLVQLCQKLFTILHHDVNKTQVHEGTPELDDLLQPMMDRPFCPCNLVHVIRERPVTSNLKCHELVPLQIKPGCAVLTQERLYFQPAQGVLETTTTTTTQQDTTTTSSSTTRAKSWLLTTLVATARRYHGLKDVALELYWKDGTSTLLALERKHEREQVLRLLPLVPCHTDRDFVVQCSQEWQSGHISNYDYLLLLNSAAGRTFQDLSRYPVFPWVISDYTSKTLDLNNPATFRDLTKPVGALNEERLEYFRQRFESMQDMENHPFFYGTHYSAAGYVLYYLVRSMPEHMLCLQNGKFDSPDRMFHSISSCYNSAMINHADVKELIPEFYNANHDFDFLINAKSLQLGAMQTGDRVNDVSLPPWAKSPRDFLKKNRKALESDICTSNLPRWIDLIFGAKSRGEAAKDASNIFHKMAYLGPADLSAMPTQEERFQAELQATEFGIVPDQLFIGPHPLRHQTVDESFVGEIGRTFSGAGDEGKGEAWELLDPPSHSGSLEFTSNNNNNKQQQQQQPGVYGHDSNMIQLSASIAEQHPEPVTMDNTSNNDHQNNPFRIHTAESLEFAPHLARKANREAGNTRVSLPLSGSGEVTARQNAGSGGAFSTLGLEPSLSNVSSSSAPAAVALPKSDASSTATSSLGEWDMKIIERLQGLAQDAISGCSFIPEVDPSKRSILATTSLDGGLKVHHVSLGASDFDKDKLQSGITSTLSRFSYMTMTRGQVTPSNQTKLTEYRSHTCRDPLACLAIASDGYGGQVAFAGGHDDVVLAYGINSGCAVASVYSHRDAVTGLDLLSRNVAGSETALWLENSTHIMISGSWDATVKVWSVTVANGETVSINREPLAELFDADSSIVCVSSAAVPGGGMVIGAGCADGSFCVWNLHSDGVKVVIHKEPARRGSGPCSVVKWSNVAGQLHLFTGFATGKVASFTLQDGSMRKASAVSVGVAVQCLVYSENILLVGCADGGLRLIPVRDGAYFTSNPTLWTAVNNKASPGISSISISYVQSTNGIVRCICCTGAEDGSVALFELKKISSR